MAWQQWTVLAIYVIAELVDIASIDPAQGRKPADTLVRTFLRVGMVALVLTI